jgi:transcriptional regulator with XRE-family HTH domain
VKESPGEVVKRWRSARGRISQEALAERIRAGGYRISMSMLSSIERNKDRPSRDTAEAIDRALDAGGEISAAFGFVTTSPSSDATRLDDVEAVVRAQARVVQAFGRAARERLGEHDELVSRLDDLEAALARLQAR